MQFIRLTVATLEHAFAVPVAAPKGVPREILVAVMIPVAWIWELIGVAVAAIIKVVVWDVLSSSELPPRDALTSRAAASITVWAADLVVPAIICATPVAIRRRHELPGGRDLFLLHICRAVKIMYGLVLGYIEKWEARRDVVSEVFTSYTYDFDWNYEHMSQTYSLPIQPQWALESRKLVSWALSFGKCLE